MNVAFAPACASSQAPAERLTFEVAAIHATRPGQLNGFIKAIPGGRGYMAENVTVKLMISLMYKVPMRQIKGGPEWLDSEHYDVEAKADRAYSLDDLHIMYQNLLADRFNLRFHTETKEGNVYALTVDQAGLKMKRNDSPEDFNIPVTYGDNGLAIGKRVPMKYLSWWLGQRLQRDERPVVDMTGLSGNYDFTLNFAPVLPPDFPVEKLPPGLLDRPSIFVAVREQLGLKLQAQKGPVEFYVIDRVDRPSDN
jgi:uncharacterized protein (TIGR03435 family)